MANMRAQNVDDAVRHQQRITAIGYQAGQTLCGSNTSLRCGQKHHTPVRGETTTIIGMRPVSQHAPLAKPAGAACNLACQYCFFLSKENFYPMRESPADDGCAAGGLHSSPVPQVDTACQRGEPMLRDLFCIHRSAELASKCRQPHPRIRHTIQTNLTLVDDEWARFFNQDHYRVGISLDGPRILHDVYRVNKHNEGSFDDALRG